MPLVDVHCHLDAPAYHDVSDVCQHSRRAGVTVTVAAGTGLRSNARILALQEQQPGQVWAALGLHPERLDASWEELTAVIAQVQAHRQRVVALGEIGLPHYALLDKRMSLEQAQERKAMLYALVRLQYAWPPVVLHTPHAASAVALDIVQRYSPPGALFHWHKGSPETTAALCQAGYFLSVTPEVCYRERDRQLVQSVPLDNLLLESDGPWAYGGEFAEQRTTSALSRAVAAEVSTLKGVPLPSCRR
jgi:TatD DNase family protein